LAIAFMLAPSKPRYANSATAVATIASTRRASRS
jgi:hypothetical protein